MLLLLSFIGLISKKKPRGDPRSGASSCHAGDDKVETKAPSRHIDGMSSLHGLLFPDRLRSPSGDGIVQTNCFSFGPGFCKRKTSFFMQGTSCLWANSVDRRASSAHDCIAFRPQQVSGQYRCWKCMGASLVASTYGYLVPCSIILSDSIHGRMQAPSRQNLI